MRLPTPSHQVVCACVIAALLAFPLVAAGEEIRVLFVPSQDPATEVRARALGRAIAADSHLVQVVKDLADADILVQFSEFRLEHRKKDGPWRWWYGRAKVLIGADAGPKDVARALHLPERFALLITGEDGGTEMDRTVAALENFLRKALGRETGKRGGEAI